MWPFGSLDQREVRQQLEMLVHPYLHMLFSGRTVRFFAGSAHFGLRIPGSMAGFIGLTVYRIRYTLV